MTEKLSGLKVEYALALIYSSEAGKREATIGFRRRPGDAGPRLPRRGAGPVRRQAGHPGEAVGQRLRRQADRPAGSPSRTRPGTSIRRRPSASPRTSSSRSRSTGRRRHRAAAAGRVHDGLRPRAGVQAARRRRSRVAGEGRGRRSRSSSSAGSTRRTSASTAATTTSTPPAAPTTRTRPRACFAEDMFLHVKGEGLNVGCCLTWGPCYDFQRQFFEPTATS